MPEQTDISMKTYIIGDIHGCAAALCALLELLKPDPAKDRLILIGDLFDRGPDSFEVFEKVKELADAFADRFVLLRGNHEDYLLTDSLSLGERLMWERVGRGATVRSFKKHQQKMEDAAPWLSAHVVPYFRGEGFQCVHAGILVDPVEENDMRVLIHSHETVFANIYSGPLTVTGHVALDEPTWFAGDMETETPVGYGIALPLPGKGVLCIDTGCGKNGHLTGMVIENGSFILYGVGQDGSSLSAAIQDEQAAGGEGSGSEAGRTDT